MLKLISTLPLYRKFRMDIVNHPLVDELRFNTVTPLDEDMEKIVSSLIRIAGNKPLWFDLKTIQLRFDEFAYLPCSTARIDHQISVDTPATAIIEYQGEIFETAVLSVIDGNQLLIERPPCIVGRGQPLNIDGHNLTVNGQFLSNRDIEYLRLCNRYGCHRFMASFVQSASQLQEIWDLDPLAEIIAKIEDQKGLDFIRSQYPRMRRKLRLMAACDDLTINVARINKMKLIEALETIIAADPNAIAASKILTSVYDEKADCVQEPKYSDFSHLWMLERMGYKTIMLSDTICRLADVFAKAMQEFTKYCNHSTATDMEYLR